MNKKLIIEQAARELAAERGAINITRKELCDHVGISDGSFVDIMDESFMEMMGRLDLPIGKLTDRKRAGGKLRRKQVLDVAIEMAKEKGYTQITRDEIAAEADVSGALISHHFKNIENLRATILKTAIHREVVEIVAQGLVQKDTIAIQAPKELKYKAVAYLAEL